MDKYTVIIKKLVVIDSNIEKLIIKSEYIEERLNDIKIELENIKRDIKTIE